MTNQFCHSTMSRHQNHSVYDCLLVKGRPPANVSLVTWQRWRSHHLVRYSQKPHATRKLHVLSSIEPELLLSEVYVVGIGITVVTLILTWYDLHIQTWPVSPRDIPVDQKWTLFFKAFKSYHIIQSVRLLPCRFAGSKEGSGSRYTCQSLANTVKCCNWLGA